MQARERSGKGELEVALVDGASALVRVAGKSPLKLVVSRERGPCVRVHAANFGGGLLAGDTVTLDVVVGAGASLSLGTSAPGKVYRSEDGRESAQHVRAFVGGGGMLAYTPAPVACFAGARYAQRTELDLADGGNILYIDTLSAGRSARGERWAFDRYDSRTRLRVDGRLVLHEAVRLEPGATSIAQRLGSHEVMSVVVIAGPALVEAGESVRQRIAEMPIRKGDPVRVAVSAWPWGVVVRAAANAPEALEQALREVLSPVATVMARGDSWHGPW